MTYHSSPPSKSGRNSVGLLGLKLNDLASHPRELARQLSFTRREFLRRAAGVTVGGTLLGSGMLARTGIPQRKRKVVVITFGGGARDQETFAPEGQENIPHLIRELIPQSTFFTQVVNRGILGHYVATASLATGVYETIDLSQWIAGNPADVPFAMIYLLGPDGEHPRPAGPGTFPADAPLTAQAADTIKAACPTEQPATPNNGLSAPI